MSHRQVLAALASTLALSLACGGGGTPEPVVVPEAPIQPVVAGKEPAPAEPEAAPEEEADLARPVSTQPGTLMVRKQADGACSLFLVTLPSLGERDVSPMDCGSDQYWLERTGKRMLGDGWLVDLEAGALVELPAPPERSNEYLRSYQFDPQGGIIATQEWGSGEETFEEGSSWEVRNGALLRLADGAWIEELSVRWGGDSPSPDEETHRWYTETSSDTEALVFRDAGLDGDWVSDEGFREVLSSLVASPPEDWFVSTEDPRLAYGTDMAGEGSALRGSVLVQDGDTWVALEGLPDYPDSLGRLGDWALVGYQGWKLYDLQVKAVVAQGDGDAWFWPADVPLP